MHHSSEPPTHPVVSPFSDAAGSPANGRRNSLLFSILAILGTAAALVATGGYFVLQRLNDPLRTLEGFPLNKYLDSYRSLSGAKFRGNLRVENDLGWKDGIGRLMVFSLAEHPEPVVVMIPGAAAQTYFTKGQSYEAELEVREGGMIYANTIRKN